MTQKLNAYKGGHTLLQVDETEQMAVLRKQIEDIQKQYADLREAEQLDLWNRLVNDPKNKTSIFDWPENITNHPYEECALELAARCARFDAQQLNFAMLVGMFLNVKLWMETYPTLSGKKYSSILEDWESEAIPFMDSPKSGIDFSCPFSYEDTDV